MRAASGSTVTTFLVCLEERERSTAQVWRGCSCEKCCRHCLEERHWYVFGLDAIVKSCDLFCPSSINLNFAFRFSFSPEPNQKSWK